MLVAVTILLIISLLIVVFQDYKKRMIHTLLPVFIFLLSTYINYVSYNLEFIFILYNCGFVVINIIGLVVYYSIKHKAFINPFKAYLGLGDLVFFLAITPLFSLQFFILFFVFGLLFSLLMHYGISLLKPIKTIPLAGYLSLFLIVNILAKDIFKIHPLL